MRAKPPSPIHRIVSALLALVVLLSSSALARAEPPNNGEGTLYLPLVADQEAGAPTNAPGAAVSPSSTPDLPPAASGRATPGQAVRIEHEGAILELGPGAVASPVDITITPLLPQHLAELDPGMTNVTRGPRHGYRFLPHMRFQEKIVVSLPYDENRIPPGLTAADIKSFYFDEEAGHWIELERVAVDTEHQVVRSLTDHFTDVVNATVTVPEHAQPASFDPTSMKTIEAANPASRINLIEPPRPTTRAVPA